MLRAGRGCIFGPQMALGIRRYLWVGRGFHSSIFLDSYIVLGSAWGSTVAGAQTVVIPALGV